MFRLLSKKIIAILSSKILLNWTYGFCQDKLHCKYVVSFLVSFFCESHILVLVYVREVIKSC